MSIQRYAPTRYSRIYEACQGGLMKYADHKKVCKEFGKMIQSLRDSDADHEAALADKAAEMEKARELLKRAYFEGWQDGNDRGFDAVDNWERSDTKAVLDGGDHEH